MIPQRLLSRGGGRVPAPSAPGNGGGSPGYGILSNVLGSDTARSVRFNRFIEKIRSPLIWKVPDDFSADEYNVALGLGNTAIAAGVTTTINVNVPRDVIIRRMIINDGLSLPNIDWLVTAIAVEGNALVLAGGLGGGVFQPNNQCPLLFNLPCTGGTTLSITVQNTGAAGIEITGGVIID